MRNLPLSPSKWNGCARDGGCEVLAFLTKALRKPGGADGLVRDNVSSKRPSGHDGNAKPLLVGTPRRGVRGGLGETALPVSRPTRVQTFITFRAGTPALPTRPPPFHQKRMNCAYACD